jgi:hypothetical protein
MEELWKPIPGYESLYEASTLGRVRSLFRYKKILKPSPVTTGYLTVELWKDKQRKRIGIHRLVAMCFCENPENKPFVNHLDETKTNNRADNLEWVTHVENCRYGTAIERRTQHLDYSKRRINNKHQIEVASKPIVQCNREGTPIKKWISITECAKALGMSPSGISKAIQRGSTTRNGYKFKEVS